MQWYDTLLSYLSPATLITDPEWRTKWNLIQKEAFLRYAGFFFVIVAVGTMTNHFLFDRAMGLEPVEFWFQFRIGLSLLCVLTAVFYFSRLTRIASYKAPALLACCVICYTQALVTIWYHLDAWIFFYVFVITCTIMLSLNIVWSLVFAMGNCIAAISVLREAGLSLEYIVSSMITTAAVTIIVRRSSVTEVQNFLLSEQNIAAQTRIAEISADFAERVQSFIPRVIADRMNNYLDDGMSVVEASIEALQAEKKNVACLFTDIRGFTQGSKNLDEFIVESVMPEVTACSNAIEDLKGIPRKVGDLIFAYFDDESVHLNVLRAIAAGIEVAQLNEAMNVSGTQVTIKRYILISAGEAMVGNFGGLDTSIEITALGTPVNFLSRVDDATKEPKIAERLNSGDIVLSETAKNAVDDLALPIPFEHLDLDELGVKIRDFPEVRSLFKVEPNARIAEMIDTVVREAASK